MKNDNCVWYKEVCEDYGTCDCSNYCIRFLEMKRLCELSNIPAGKWKPTALYCDRLDNSAFSKLSQIKGNMKDWVEGGNNLYIYSENTGNGKTSWSIKLMLSYFNQIWSGNGFRTRGLFISVPSFLFMHKELMNNFDEHFFRLKDMVSKVDLVIWDDIGVAPLTQYEHQLLLTYIDNRVLTGKANIYTGNVDKVTLEKYLGLRLASRIWNSSDKVHFMEADKRTNQGVKING